ncbi:MAG: DNA primase [Planctomycetaceae bacterium]
MSDATEFKELVRARTDIVSIIGESIALNPKRGGSEFVGLCPFHPDHNPSLHVYPDRQSFRCWVCDEGGDVFSFVMKHDGVTFGEAVELLGERAGLERPKRSAPAPGTAIDKPRLYDVLAWADRQFRTCLKTSSEAKEVREYVASRGISSEMVERFGLGYVPRDWQWLLGRARGTYTVRDLTAAGLVKERRDGSGSIDFFVDRLMFPIRDERSRPVSFGGRILPGRGEEAGPKYLNGGDTTVFSKSKLVYALEAARETIRQTGNAAIMEGYTDCIAAHQHGYSNVVATLGTALAESHVTLLKRFAKTVVLVFDGDDAGLNAAERALVRFLAQDVDLRILALPEGLDPADYLAKDTQGRFGELVTTAPTALEFKLHTAINRFGLDTDLGTSRVIDDVLGAISSAPGLPGTTREGTILQRIASRTGIREQQIREELKRLRSRNPSPARPSNQPSPQIRPSAARPDDPAEREVLSVVLTRPDLFDLLARQLGPDDFSTPRLRAVFEHCRDVADLQGIPAYDLLMSSTDDLDLKQVLVGLDADARRRNLPGLLGDVNFDAGSTERPASGTDAAETDVMGTGAAARSAIPSVFLQVVQYLIERRRLSQWQQSRGQFIRHHAGRPLDDDAKEQLRRLHQQLATRHAP